jgi:hypothetical protein
MFLIFSRDAAIFCCSSKRFFFVSASRLSLDAWGSCFFCFL